MEMVGHEAIGAEAHGFFAFQRLGEDTFEGFVIGIVFEEFDVAPGPVHDVIGDVAGGKAWVAGHGGSIIETGDFEKAYDPFSVLETGDFEKAYDPFSVLPFSVL